MAFTISPMPLTVLVELVNGWGSAPRVEAGEQDEPYPPRLDAVGAWLDATAVDPPGDSDLAATADQLHPVFATSEPTERAALLNRLLQVVQLQPEVRADHGGLTRAWSVDPERALLASAVVALWSELTAPGAHRLGTCAGHRCVDVYLDSSPGQQRRFCSVTCQTRARVAAHRRRHASERER